MKVILIVWLLGQWGPTMPVPVQEYKGDKANVECQMALDRWNFIDRHKGMCLRVGDPT